MKKLTFRSHKKTLKHRLDSSLCRVIMEQEKEPKVDDQKTIYTFDVIIEFVKVYDFYFLFSE